MPRPAAPLLALALGAAAATALVACGGEDAQLLPGGTAREITANLDTVKQLADEGDCVGAESAARQVGEQIDALGGVDRKLKRALRDGAARLNEVVAGCEESTEEAVAPAVVPAETESEEEKSPQGKAKGHDKKPTDETTTSTPEPTTPTGPPPASPGEGGEAPPGEDDEDDAESPSGGLSPSSPAGEAE